MGQKNLHDYLSSITADNNAGEYYLTDLVRLIDKGGGHVGYELAPEEECLGVNSQADLAQAEKIFQDRVRSHMLASGVRMPDPSSVFFSHGYAGRTWRGDRTICHHPPKGYHCPRCNHQIIQLFGKGR